MKLRRIYSVDAYHDNRRVRPEIVLVALICILAVGAGTFIYRDLRNNDTFIDNSNNRPVLGKISSDVAAFKRVETDNYEMEIPENWTRVNSPEVIVKGIRYYPDRYQGTTGENIGRRIDIYHREIPAELPVAKVLEVEVDGDSVFPRELSPQCITFTDTGGERVAGEPYPSKWNNINFTCKTSQVSNEISALQSNSASGLQFVANGKRSPMALVFMDHGSDQDNEIFFRILRSFRAK